MGYEMFDMRRVTAERACGPSGGLTMWAAYVDGELFILYGETSRTHRAYGLHPPSPDKVWQLLTGDEMKIWNVGLTTATGENIGWHVSADDADQAIAKARNCAAMNNTALYAGATVQRRVAKQDDNKYFDGAFRYVGALL